MTALAHLRKGWCPGALRPMRSGDGLLVRVRPRAGALSSIALRVVADVAARFGSGEIDLTNRGNLQIRGVTDETFEPTLAALDAAGLLDPSVDAESVRNVVVDPLSGVDPARANVRDLAAALERTLVRDTRLWSLPGKFGFSFSGVAAPQVGGRSADIMISGDDDRFFVTLEGAVAARCEISRQDAVEAAHHLALAFVELKENDASFRRMRDAVARLGVATVFAMAGLRVSAPVAEKSEHAVPVGLLKRDDCVIGVGVGLPFGRMTAMQLDALCNISMASGVEEAHTSPERALIFPMSNAACGSEMLRSVDAAGLIVRHDDIRLAMDVCPGAPACKSARANTRRDAQRFAETFAGSLCGRSVHISGCEKGCARRTDASFTLVGQADGYDIIRNGSADSTRVHEAIKAEEISSAISRLVTERAI
ncbi:MAG TPA: precorrin-3B synthase [Hyphomicrobium sp.]|nr:precorrin-3B synthase [Hyphomicrobium sp.]